MAFWGLSLKPGKVTPYVPAPDAPENVHISQCCLAPDSKPGSKATILLKVGENDALAIACLREGTTDSLPLDLILDHYSEFEVKGNAEVHITGYHMPQYELDEDHDFDDDEDEDLSDPYGLLEDHKLFAEGGTLIGHDDDGQPVFAEEYDSDDDSDFDSDDDGEAGLLLGGDDDEYTSSDEDEEDDESSEDDEDPELQLMKRGVVIEDITDSEPAALNGKDNGKKKAAAPTSNGKAAAFKDDDVEGSDSEEDDEESSESEEEEPKAANKKQPSAGDKRKATEQKEKPATKKQNTKNEKKTTTTPDAAKDANKEESTPGSMGKDKVRRWPNGFEIHVQRQGRADGKLAKMGKKVVVKYVGKLKNGKQFDASNKFAFRLGT